MRALEKTPVTSPDRRRSGRRHCDLAARIRVPGFPMIMCRVLDISPMGAMFELETLAIMPATFTLQIPNDLFSVECDLRHQNGQRCGVLFTSNRQEAMSRYS